MGVWGNLGREIQETYAWGREVLRQTFSETAQPVYVRSGSDLCEEDFAGILLHDHNAHILATRLKIDTARLNAAQGTALMRLADFGGMEHLSKLSARDVNALRSIGNAALEQAIIMTVFRKKAPKYEQ